MGAKWFLYFAVLLACSQAAYCPTFTCDTDLGANVCSVYSSGSAYKLNSNGCQPGYVCSATAVALWAEIIHANGSTDKTSFLCTAYTPPAQSTWTAVNCGTKLANKNFKSGNIVIPCTADTDCVLADYTYTLCMCVLGSDGKGVCQASTSNDQVYGGFWRDCGSGGTISDQDIAEYWAFYMMYWEYGQSTVECMSIFMETTMQGGLLEAYNGAGTLAATVVGLLTLY